MTLPGAAEGALEARGLIDDLGYFVVHAPRQTGKTTTLQALAQALTAEGRYAAVHFSCEVAAPFCNDVTAAERVVCKALINTAVEMLPAELHPPRCRRTSRVCCCRPICRRGPGLAPSRWC